MEWRVQRFRLGMRMRKTAQARGEKLRMTMTPAAINTNKVANS